MKEEVPTKRYLIEVKGESVEGLGSILGDIKESVNGISDYALSHDCWIVVTKLPDSMPLKPYSVPSEAVSKPKPRNTHILKNPKARRKFNPHHYPVTSNIKLNAKLNLNKEVKKQNGN